MSYLSCNPPFVHLLLQAAQVIKLLIKQVEHKVTNLLK